MKRRYCIILCSLIPVVLASCVFSHHPLSNEKTSKVDERLIGAWTQVRDDPNIYQMFIGRRPGTENTLEQVSLSFRADKTVKLNQTKMFARPGKTKYFSIQVEPDVSAYWIGKYDLPDEETLRLHTFDMDVFGKAVENGKLKGTVERETIPARNNGESKSGPFKSVTLTDEPEAILQFIAKRGEECFGDLLVYRKKSRLLDPKQSQ